MGAAAVFLQAQGKKPVPYHGYFFHILKAQGPDAPGGAMATLARQMTRFNPDKTWKPVTGE